MTNKLKFNMNFFQNYSKLVNGIKDKNSSAYSVIFICISCVLFFIFAVGLVNNPFGPQRQIFYLGTAGFFGDFFYNMWATVDRDPYTREGGVWIVYFPLPLMIFNFFSKLDNYGEMTTYQQVANSKMAIMSGFFFIGFSIFLLYMSLNKIARKYHISPFVLISLFLSFTFFFAIERGNIIVLSAASVGFFICYYDSKKKSERVLAAICLALATVLKIYPVLFGFLYFEKKQYREIFLSAIIAILFAFLPFLYLKNGFANIPHLFNMLRAIQQGKPDFSWSGLVESQGMFNMSHMVYVISILFGLPRETIMQLYNVFNLVTYLIFFISILFSFFTKDKWLKISLLCLTVVFVPKMSSLYCGLYLFPVIIIFFSRLREFSYHFIVFTLIVFLVFLSPYQIAIVEYYNITYLFSNIALITLWLVLLVYSGKDIFKLFKRKIQTVRV
jgi:hypothetical protein